MQETKVWSPGREDPLEKEMATHSSIAEEPEWDNKEDRKNTNQKWGTKSTKNCIILTTAPPFTLHLTSHLWTRRIDEHPSWI